MSRMRLLSAGLLVAAMALAADSAAAAELTENFDKTYAARPGGVLALENTNGAVVVQSWDRNEIRIQAEKRVEGGSKEAAAEAMRNLKIDVRENGSRLEVSTQTPRGTDGFFEWLAGKNVNANVHYTVTVPRKIDLELETTNGHIEVHEVAGLIRIDTTNGGIEATRCSGRVNASTTNGKIRAELTSVDRGGMKLETTNGSVMVNLPATAAATINASTTNGAIRSDFPMTVSGEISKHHLRGTINGGGDEIRVRTTNGSIEIGKAGK